MTPATKEVWIAVDADGIPSSAPHSDEGSAEVTAAALNQNMSQYGPHRVQKYVVEDRVEFVHEWYANRFERLRVWANTSLTESLRHQYFNIVANGTAEMHEPPTYAQLLNTKQHAERVLKDVMVASAENSLASAGLEAANAKLEADLEAAHATIRAMLTGVDRGNMAPVSEVMSALIGAMQTEDGLAVVRYCGHLERLLKEARAHAGEDVPKPDDGA